MAWKNYSRGKSRKTKPYAARRPSLARIVDRKRSKQYQWVPLFDPLCVTQETDCRACVDEGDNQFISGASVNCETGAVEELYPLPPSLVLLPPADVPASVAAADQAAYQADGVTIVRLVGHITLCPIINVSAAVFAQCTSDPDNCPSYNQFQNQFKNYHLRAALAKDRWLYDYQANTYNTVTRNPLYTEEWSDAQFLRQWERQKLRPRLVETARYSGTVSPGCYGNVSAAGAGAPANTLSSGSGTVNIPAISTTAAACPPLTVGQFVEYGPDIDNFTCVRLSLNSRRRLVFKENEGLTFWFNWTAKETALMPGPDWIAPVSWEIHGSVKALVEY